MAIDDLCGPRRARGRLDSHSLFGPGAPEAGGDAAANEGAAKPAVPFRDIHTLDSALLKKLSPHFSDWIVENPERVRDRRAGHDLCFFARTKKGDWVAVKRFPRNLEIGQKAYAFCRRPSHPAPPPGSGGGGGAADAWPARSCEAQLAAPPLVPTVRITSLADGDVLGLNRDDYRHFKQGFTAYAVTVEQRAEEISRQVLGYCSREPIVNFNDFVRFRQGVCYPGDQVRVPRGATLLVEGSAENTASVQFGWSGPDSGSLTLDCPPAGPNQIFAWRAEIPQAQPGEYTLTARVSGQEHRLKIELREAIFDMAYLPGANELLLLTAEESERLKGWASDLERPVRYFEAAQRRGEEAAVIAAKEELSRKVETLVSGPGSDGITEVILFRGRKWAYVPSAMLNERQRVYKLDAEIRQRRELIHPDKKNSQGAKKVTVSLKDLEALDGRALAKKIRKDFAEGPEGKFKYDLAKVDDLTLALQSWALPLAEKGDWFEAGAEEQLLRFTAGAGVTAGFNPKTKAISLKAEAKTDFALLEGKIGCTVSLPGKDGYDVVIQMPKKGSGEIVDLPLGAFLVEIETALTGYSGAKAIACADLSFTMKQGQLLLGGLTSAEAKKLKTKDKDFTPAKAEINAFAGASAGCEATGSLKWDNPEKRAPGKKRDFHLLASIGGEVSARFGAGAECGVYLGYEYGRFMFRAKAGVVLGPGCGGEVVYTVDVKNTIDVVQFVYHKLMQADFDYLGFIQDDAFKAVELLVTKCLWLGEEINELAEKGYEALVDWWDMTQKNLDDEEKAQQEAERLAERILGNPDMLRFAPPEVKGRILRTLCQTSWRSDEEEQEEAIMTILEWTQSLREYREILEHMTLDGATIPMQKGHAILLGILDGRERLRYKMLPYTLAASSEPGERTRSGIPMVAMAGEPVQKRVFV